MWTHPTAMNNYSLLADAWVKGRAWIEYPGEYIDAVPFHGHAYVIEAPFPGILMLPFAEFAHGDANQSLMGAIVFSVGCGAVAWLARDLGFAPIARLMFVVFTALGTSLYYCAWQGDVWYFAHVCTFTFTMIALLLIVNGAKPEFIVFCAIAAGLSRFTLMPVVLLYLAYLYATRGRATWGRITLEALSIAIPAAALVIWYNYARWGVPYDLGYTYFYHVMVDHSGSAFDTRYFRTDLWMMFAVPPVFTAALPFVAPGTIGPGLLFMSWPLGAAFFARRPAPLVVLLWLATAATLIPNLIYFSFGDVHFGSRHALDFIPFLLVLAMLAVRPRSPRWFLGAMALMSAFSAWLLAHYEAVR